MLGDAAPDRYRHAIAACAADPAVQGLLVLLAPQAVTDAGETARQLVPFAKLPGKPILASWMGGEDVRAGRRVLSQAGIPSFDAPEAAIGAFLNMVQYTRNQELLYETPRAVPGGTPPDRPRLEQVIAGARAAGRTLLTEVEAKDLLSAYGIPATPTVHAASVDAAVAAAERVGYPVVLKLHSKTITHKSDVGGVQLDLAGADAVRSAFMTIRQNLAQRHPRTPFEGVTVQPMVRGGGYELIIGSSVDAQFGPVILFGAGGTLVEVLRDRELALPPINRSLARRLIERTQIYKALLGTRGKPAIDFDALETLLVRFSQLLCDCQDIVEVDMNPVLASAERVVALDARVVLAPPDLPADKRPKLAIRPYPDQYTSQFKLTDGTEVRIRAIQPEDEPLIIEFHAGHSERTIRMRFFGMVKQLSRDSLIRLCHLDYDRAMALVAEIRDAEGRPHLCGVSRYYLDPETRTAEFAIVVGDAWQGKGLGYHLMDRLADAARQNGASTLIGTVLSENDGMLKLTREMGFSREPGEDPATVHVALDLFR